MIPIAHYLFAAAFSGAYNKQKWQEWADIQITNLPICPDWLCQVSLATTIHELSKVLADKIIEEKNTHANLPPIADAVIGYYYLGYLNGEFTLNELLIQSGQEADATGASSVECEHFFSISTMIERDPTVSLNPLFIKEIEALYEPFKTIADYQKQQLEEYANGTAQTF